MKPVTQTTDGRITEALNLLKDADSVELKLTVPDGDYHSSIAALNLDVLDAELCQVIFFDTRDLRLNRTGLVMRARRMRKGGDSVVKLRNVRSVDLPDSLRHSAAFKMEVDAMPGTIVCSGSLKGKTDNSDVKQVLLSKRPLKTLFSREQRELYKTHAPKRLVLDSLIPMGPINVAKLKFRPPTFKRLMTAEVWFYPDASRVLELSTKCAPNKAFQVLAELRAFLLHHGINLTGIQETKTRRALRYFSHLGNRK
ncbi:MAG TPA: adenylate cyclase [Terriglobia bacterium]|jgi:hypothetical protein